MDLFLQRRWPLLLGNARRWAQGSSRGRLWVRSSPWLHKALSLWVLHWSLLKQFSQRHRVHFCSWTRGINSDQDSKLYRLSSATEISLLGWSCWFCFTSLKEGIWMYFCYWNNLWKVYGDCKHQNILLMYSGWLPRHCHKFGKVCSYLNIIKKLGLQKLFNNIYASECAFVHADRYEE